MKWFRTNVRRCSWLALIALAVQLAATFGHVHGFAAQAAPVIRSEAAKQALVGGGESSAAIQQAASPQQPSSDRDSDQPNDICAICVAMALAHSVLFASPPVLLLPQAVEFLHRTTDAEFIHLHSAHSAFQSRAPPLS